MNLKQGIVCLLFVSCSALSYSQEYIYGLTQNGGLNNKGVPYQITTSGTGYISYTDFNSSNGEKPGNGAGFTQLSASNLSALTELGDQTLSIGYRVNIVSGQGGLLAPFQFHFSVNGTGTNPRGKFFLAHNGQLYGLTSAKAEFDGGGIFSVPAFVGNGAVPLHAFNGANTGKSPSGSLIQGSDGKLYGMTELGGINNLGVIFSFDIYGGTAPVKKLVDFDGLSKGSKPTGNLVLASDGKLYGMTTVGGSFGGGVLFSLNLDGTGFTKLLDFNGAITGTQPRGSLVQFADGKLYGMTSSGGANGFGTIFSIVLNGAFTKILDFNGTNGKTPIGDLLVAPSGAAMYGTTYSGGVNDKGVLFKLENGNQFTKLYDYSLATGSNPVGSLTMLKQTPTITFPSIPEKNTLSGAFTPVVETSVGLPVYYLSSDPSVAVIENNQVKITGQGGAYITAFQLGSHGYLTQSATQILSVKKVKQTITFQAIPVKTFGDPSFTVLATSSSGLPVTFTTFSNNVITGSGDTFSIIGGGTVSILARQTGDPTYEAAPDVTQTLVVNPAEQTINFQTSSVRSCCQSFNLSATSTSLLHVLFKTPDRDKLDIYQSLARIVGLGTVEIIAYQPGNSTYKPAEARVRVDIQKGEQFINFSISKTIFNFGDAPYPLSSLSSSGLPLTFKSDPPGVAVVDGQSLIILGVGTTTITATQPGNTVINAAIPKSVTVTINAPTTPGVGNTISWQDLPIKFVNDPPFNLKASASSGLAVNYTSSNPSVAEISGNQVVLKGPGTTTIAASQPGANLIPAATSVQKVLQVNKKEQYINLQSISPVNYRAEPITLPVTTNEGLPIEYTSADINVATVENFYLVFKEGGSSIITAKQPGNENYLPASSVSIQARVNPISQSIVFNSLPEKIYGDLPFNLTASASSGLPISFNSNNPSIASIEGSSVTIKQAGTVTIRARQQGSPSYLPVEMTKQLTINKKSQTITFGPLTSKKFGDAPFEISAVSDSNLPVVFSSLTPGVAKVSNNLISIVGNGTAIIEASQPGNQNYLSAVSVTQSFLVADVGNTYNIVGSTLGGGPNNSGLLYSLSSEGSGFSTLKQFDIRTTPIPQAGFIKGVDGKMYGNLFFGGVYNSGRIIRLEADGTGFTVLHNYQIATGTNPYGNLIQATNGDLYGMTRSGGSHSGGTIFRIKTDGTGFTVLYHFTAASGNAPMGGLVQAGNGKLYGMTQNAGFFSSGTIFSINADGSGYEVIFNFNNNEPVMSGLFPRGDLIDGADGFLYGTLMQGGSAGQGTLFKIKTDGSAFSKIIEFDGANYGSSPASTLIRGSDGKLYGMTQAGGTSNMGTIYSVNTNGTNYTRLLDFDRTLKGAYPGGKLTEGIDGLLYGTTYFGGVNNLGIVFKIARNGANFQKITDLDSKASNPVFGPLLESTAGNFFGMTSQGGANNGGVIFSVTSAGVFKVVKDFPQEEYSPKSLVSDPGGEFYYGIASGGISGNGSIFRMSANGSSYQRILDIPTDFSVSKLFYISTGHLWLMASQNGVGFIFRIKPDGSEFQRIVEFDNAVQKGTSPLWLEETSNGAVFGNALGGSNGSGLFYKIKNDATGFTKIADMPQEVELNPGMFISASDGNLYGCTTYNSYLYKITESGSFTKIFTFPINEVGEVPMKIIELNGGNLGIITRDHGTLGYGSIFTVEKAGTGYSKIFNMETSRGTSPSNMLQTMDGWMYVAAQMGGSFDKGVIYKVRGDGSSYTKVYEFNGADGDIPNSLVFKKVAQSFTFNPLSEKMISDPAFIPEVSSSSGAPVHLSSSNPTIAKIENGRIKPVSVGTTTITASLPASANFFKASDIQRQLIVTKGNQSIIFDAINPIQISGSQLELKAITTSGLPVLYKSSNIAVATIVGNIATIVGIGTTTITASQEGDDNYFAAAEVAQTLTVNKGSQIVTFAALNNKTFGSAPFALTASASSELTVSYSSSNTQVATVVGNTVTIVGVGTTNILASQVGDANYDAAADVEQILTVNKGDQTISFAALADKTFGDVAFALTASVSSNLLVNYSSTSDEINISGNQVTLVKAGRATITAAQAGNENYNSANSVAQDFCIKPAKPTIALSNGNNETVTLTSSSISGNQWYLNGSVINGAINTTFIATQVGVYKVQVKVDDCMSEFSNDQSFIITGDIEDTTNTSIEIYPNPVSDWLHILLGESGGLKDVTILEMNGRKTDSQQVSGSEAIFHLAQYSTGIYLVKVKTENTVRIIKFEKQ